MPKESKARAAKGEGKAKKTKKDGPKRPLSAYMYFSKAERETVKGENPSASFGELGKLLGDKWKTLSDQDKAPYVEQAAKDKARYEDEVKAGGGEVKAKKSKKAAAADEEEDEEAEDDE